MVIRVMLGLAQKKPRKQAVSIYIYIYFKIFMKTIPNANPGPEY